MEKYSLKEVRGLVIVRGGDDENNRKAVSDKKVNILLSPEKGRGKDLMFQRNSGLDQVLCKLAKQNNVAIGFDFDSLLNSQDRADLLGKMMQNIRLCRKYKIRMILDTFSGENREISVLKSFGRVIGMTGKEIKNAFFYKRFK